MRDNAYSACKREEKRAYIREYRKLHRQYYLDRQKEREVRLRKKSIEYINSIKLAPCLDCKQTFPPFCMDFDHISNDKYMSINRMVGHKCLNRIKKEISKCELVCSNCHRIRTQRRAITKKPVTPNDLRKYANRMFVNEFKRNKRCADCSIAHHSSAMDFDHLEASNKIIKISHMLNRNQSTILAEMSKCELVCSNCHRKRHYANTTRVVGNHKLYDPGRYVSPQ